MNSDTPNHYTLTKKQQAILNLLYRFRFATSQQLSQTLTITKATTNKRLKLMMELKYIGRRYKPEYRLLRKHAAYYLLPNGISALKKISNKKYIPKVLRNIHNDENSSDQFANHCLAMFDIYCLMRKQQGEGLQFFTKTQIAAASYFPKQPPDAHIQIGSEPKLFLLDLLHHDQPFFRSTGAVIRYIDYADEDKWPENYEFPKILLICDNPSLQKRLLKKMHRRIENLDDPRLKFYITNVNNLKDDTWHDMSNPDETLSLSQI